MVVKDPAPYTAFLVVFTVLLYSRVLGQVIVYLYAPRWLPAMDEWQSGLLPYPVLLASQIVVLSFMTIICVDFARQRGFFFDPPPRGGAFSLWFSAAYFGGMIFRYVITMMRKPERRWFGGAIPIVFHSFVAAFLWTWGRYQT